MKTVHYENIDSIFVFVHGMDCDDPQGCDESCNGFAVRPSRKDFAAIVAAKSDDKPIPGWDYTAAELRQMFGIA